MSNDSRILLHGWGMSPEVFGPLLDRWDPDTAVNPALPGYPRSPWPDAIDFAAQIEVMGRDLPAGHLIGWSMGGLYAIELAWRFPGKFDRLTLLACNPCFVRCPGWDCGVDASVFDRFGDDLARDWQRTLRRFVALQTHGVAESRQLARSLGEMTIARGAPGLSTLVRGLECLKSHDARQRLAQLSQPVSLILGERDQLVPIALKSQIREVAAGIRVESVAGAAHALLLSHSAEVVAMIDRTG